MPTIAEALAAADLALSASGVAESRREAASLLSFALEKDRTFLIAHSEDLVPEAANDWFQAAVKRRSAKEPYHYIVGWKEFYGLRIDVSPGVLIPRPETELLAEQAIAFLRKLEKPRFCEAGLGSGCISAAILSNVPNAKGVGLEISDVALEAAKRNLGRLQLISRIEVRRSDLFSAVRPDERFDLIVSNPPYIPVSEIPHLQAEVREYEPHIALTDGDDGLSVIRSLVAGSPEHLSSGGILAFEIGFGQSPTVVDMFDRNVWREVNVEADLQGIDRVVIARMEGH
ncbi:MAG TPA: peptide chain release factor N(5)-glutamine methyltransferase [Pyrinomonadaceae bacterium]|nr:peptide chain release factor N(5)-glutamine methyltransferase [Pyrinomonadaceae bacterium]